MLLQFVADLLHARLRARRRLRGHPAELLLELRIGPDRLVPVFTATYRFNDDGSVPWRAWDDEVIAIATDGPSIVYRFCHHRTDVRDEANPLSTYFWYQPLASVSPDGRWLLFSSNWEKSLGADPTDPGRSRQDVFLVALEGSAA